MKTLKRYVLLAAAMICFLILSNKLHQWNAAPADEVFESVIDRQIPRIRPIAIAGFKAGKVAKTKDFTPTYNHFTTDEISRNCTVSSCFNPANCQPFTVSIAHSTYTKHHTTPNFEKIMRIISKLPYYIQDPEKACVTIFDIDTLDRDFLSENFIRNLGAEFSVIEGWPLSEMNSLFFNVFSGTYPAYSEKVDFPVIRAILAKSSASFRGVRRGLDIGFPLVNINQYPERLAMFNSSRSSSFLTLTSRDRHLLTFKGKRYVHGGGSATRDKLHAVSNSHDVTMLTTCEHGKDWRARLRDDVTLRRCEGDIRTYHLPQNEYWGLLNQSTFCLVPRGRRLDSYRLLEVMRAGCIPVILANQGELPFSEVIDWRLFSVLVDERTTTQVSSIVRAISVEHVNFMKSQAVFIFSTYFSSLEAIIRTTLKLVAERVAINRLPRWVWNTAPGALYYDMAHSTDFSRFPFSIPSDLASYSKEKVRKKHSLIVVRNAWEEMESCLDTLGSLTSLPSRVSEIVFVSIVSPSDRQFLASVKSPRPIRFAHLASLLLLDKAVSSDNDVIIRVDCSSHVSSHQVKALWKYQTSHPDRIVGFNERVHVWSDREKNYLYSSRQHETFSIVQLSNSAHHKYYYHLARSMFSSDVKEKMLNMTSTCLDIVMNMLVSHVTSQPPILLASSDEPMKSQETAQPYPIKSQENINSDQPIRSRETRHFHSIEKSTECMRWFANELGYMPLRTSRLKHQI